VACNLLGEEYGDTGIVDQGFGREFAQAVHETGADVGSFSLRRGYMLVDEQGRKWTARYARNGKAVWTHGDRDYKIIVTPEVGEDGTVEYKYRKAPAGEGNFQRVTAGTDGALSLPDDPILFKDGVQVNGKGEAVDPNSLGALTSDELEQVGELFGEEYTGRLIRAGDTFVLAPQLDVLDVEPGLRNSEENFIKYKEGIPGLTDPGQLRRTAEFERLSGEDKISEIRRRLPEKVGARVGDDQLKAVIDASVESLKMRQAMERDQIRVEKAVLDRVDAYREETGLDVVIVPDSVTLEDGVVKFKVVPRETPDDPSKQVALEVDTSDLLETPKLLEAKQQEAEAAKARMDAAGEHPSAVHEVVGHVTFAGGLAMTAVGLLQSIGALEEHKDWKTIAGSATASYFAAHSAYGGFKQILNTELGKAVAAGARRVAQEATELAVKGIAKVLGTTAEEVSEGLKAGAAGLRGIGEAVGRALPFIGIAIGLFMVGMDIYELSQAKTTAEKARLGVDLALDTITVVLDVVGSAFPPA
ncbi:MAG: hypothetical protein MI747_00425, partial [Desulfobacterales bacterium]|nr:hypothetical protein [Desulfobacterales bacterium]